MRHNTPRSVSSLTRFIGNFIMREQVQAIAKENECPACAIMGSTTDLSGMKFHSLVVYLRLMMLVAGVYKPAHLPLALLDIKGAHIEGVIEYTELYDEGFLKRFVSNLSCFTSDRANTLRGLDVIYISTDLINGVQRFANVDGKSILNMFQMQSGGENANALHACQNYDNFYNEAIFRLFAAVQREQNHADNQ